MTTITTNAELRGLLRTGRKHARLSQKDAALKAGVSPAWWKRVESAYETSVAPDTLAAMLESVGVLPEHLYAIGDADMAQRLLARQSFRVVTAHQNNHQDPRALEEYLMKAPAPEDLRQELVAYVRARCQLTPGRTEPFSDQFLPGGE